MIDYIFVFFLPGSAGNFFCRSLNLASDRHYCFASADEQPVRLDLTLEEKFQRLGYHQHVKGSNWLDLEKKQSHYSWMHTHHELPAGSYSIWFGHPDYSRLREGLVGPDDRQWVFYIDPTEHFEWVTLNALFKNSMINVNWLRSGQKMLEDPGIHKINLGNVIAGAQGHLAEIDRVAEIVGFDIAPANRDKIQQLWQQWEQTMLRPGEFDDFKRQIGFYL